MREPRTCIRAPPNSRVVGAGDTAAAIVDVQSGVNAIEIVNTIINGGGFGKVPVLARNGNAERRKLLPGVSKKWKLKANMIGLTLSRFIKEGLPSISVSERGLSSMSGWRALSLAQTSCFAPYL
jgi:hypothetical protein